ncbi:hypothetical protein Indivirus_13_6 [Indivirus ILV1]|uniref:Uncharacterized protein n=1 Tax=Indivirus ILV1 TaxID=1977633 RepID=A0A1V0SEF3_9VIRU|nr:hypothetical protein Indivirus_13_6 [Indivirus ILV1]
MYKQKYLKYKKKYLSLKKQTGGSIVENMLSEKLDKSIIVNRPTPNPIYPNDKSLKCTLISTQKKNYYKFTYDGQKIVNRYKEYNIEGLLDNVNTNTYNNCCNCISLTLYTKDCRDKRLKTFMTSLLASVINIKKHLPGWLVRIYFDETVYNCIKNYKLPKQLIFNKDYYKNILHDMWLGISEDRQSKCIVKQGITSYTKGIFKDILNVSDDDDDDTTWDDDYVNNPIIDIFRKSINEEIINAKKRMKQILHLKKENLSYENLNKFKLDDKYNMIPNVFNFLENNECINIDTIPYKDEIEKFINLIDECVNFNYNLNNNIPYLFDKIISSDNVEVYTYLCDDWQLVKTRSLRFLPLIQEDVNICIIRDADGIVSKRDCININLFSHDERKMFYLINYGNFSPFYGHYSSWLQNYAPQFMNKYKNAYQLLAGCFGTKIKIKEDYYNNSIITLSNIIHPDNVGFDELILLYIYKNFISVLPKDIEVPKYVPEFISSTWKVVGVSEKSIRIDNNEFIKTLLNSIINIKNKDTSDEMDILSLFILYHINGNIYDVFSEDQTSESTDYLYLNKRLVNNN